MNAPVELLHLTDATIQGMFADARFLAVAPCLANLTQNLAQQKAGCGRCQAKLARLQAHLMTEARRCLTSLAAPARSQLKQLLNAKKVRITKVSGGGKKIVVTF